MFAVGEEFGLARENTHIAAGDFVELAYVVEPMELEQIAAEEVEHRLAALVLAVALWVAPEEAAVELI